MEKDLEGLKEGLKAKLHIESFKEALKNIPN